MPASAEEVMSGSELAWRPALHLGGTFGLAFWKCYPATILPGNNSVPGTLVGWWVLPYLRILTLAHGAGISYLAGRFK